MVHGANKSSSRKRKDVRTTSGNKRIFVEKKASKAHSVRGHVLLATPTGSASEMKKIPKTQKRPNRPYGGVMTSSEMRAYLKAQARLSLE